MIKEKSFPLMILVMIFLVLPSKAGAQQEDILLGKRYNGLAWNDFIQKIEKSHPVKIFFNREELPNLKIKIEQDSLTLKQVLTKNLSPYEIRVSNDQEGNYFLLKNRIITAAMPDDFFQSHTQETQRIEDSIPGSAKDKNFIKTYKDYISETITVGSMKKSNEGKKPILEGYVTSDDGKPLPSATLKIEELEKFTTTNTLGYYSLPLERGKYTLTVSSMGSYNKKYKLTILSGGQLDISLKLKPFEIGEAVVSAERNHNVRTTQMGMEKINSSIIKKLPVVMGEQDIVKVALLLPGIQTVSEVSSGFNVRGSPADQNLFFIDDLPVYNITHLFGLFTAVNSDAIEDFSVYKSNIPVKYGGRLSSILDIHAKDGNMKEFSARGGISPVSGRMIAEGPIKKNKSSYLVGMRSTYADWILSRIKDPAVTNSSASFRDGLIKLTFNRGEKNQFRFISYGSQDKSDLTIGTKSDYSNLGAALNWKHRFNEKLEGEMTLLHSNYGFLKEKSEISYLASRQSFELNHSEMKLNLNHTPHKNHNIQYGVNFVLYHLNQGDLKPLNEGSFLTPVSFEKERGVRNSMFVRDEWQIFPDFTIKVGIRGTLFSYLGPKTVYSYPDRAPRERLNITDTAFYRSNSIIKNHTNLDYRIAGKYQINDDFSIKASYNRLHQYVFSLRNTISATPTDYWKLSDSHIKPMDGEQYSFGLYKNFLGDKVESSLEGYYKTTGNLVEPKDGALFATNEVPETDIIQGDLEAYGIEFMIKKKTNKFNGWLNYTWSNTQIKAVNQVTGEMNNLGYPYPAEYDKPHSLNMTLNYKLTKRFSFSANVVYSTGRPVTYPEKIYYQDGIQITGYSRRNEYRLPDYFRSDLSLTIEGNLKKDKFAHGSWNISLYNVTGRNNPYSVYFKNNEGKVKGYRLSIFGTMIPSITYNLKLGNYAD
jgi:hypothetical protein